MLSGIFGSGPSGPDFSAAAPYMGTLATLGRGSAAQSGYLGGLFDTNSAANQRAMQAYSDYLTANPATQQYNAEQTANAERGASEGAQRATANFEQSLAQRGISPNSSIGVGGLALINEGLAANNANIQAQIGERNQAQHAANLAANANLWGNAAAGTFGQYTGATGQAAGINQDLIGNADQQAIANYNAALQRQQMNDQFLGALGSAAAPVVTQMAKQAGWSF